MVARSTFHLRFAVGSPEGPRSSVYRLWSDKKPKSNVYLAVRHIAGALKASFHESGRWQVSFIEKYVEDLEKVGKWWRESRHIDRWKRPAEVHPGVTLAFKIIIPASELRNTLYENPKRKPVLWLSAPAAGNIGQLSFVFTKLQQGTSCWLEKAFKNSYVLAEVPLANGETLCILYNIAKMTPEMIRFIQDRHAEIVASTPDYSRSNIKLEDRKYPLIYGGAEADGTRFWLELAVEGSKIQVDGS